MIVKHSFCVHLEGIAHPCSLDICGSILIFSHQLAYLNNHHAHVHFGHHEHSIRRNGHCGSERGGHSIGISLTTFHHHAHRFIPSWSIVNKIDKINN